MKPEYKQKDIRSYVIRAGRMTGSQKKAFDYWWPRYGLGLFDGKLQLDQVFEREAPLVLEVGFGMGDSLFAMAKADPDTNFIGIEVHPPGVGRLINLAGQDNLTNLRVFMADAKDVLVDCIPDNVLSRFQLYFPDPWHKKKHHKRRIVQPDFIETVCLKLKQGGLLHMATDWEGYAEHMMAVLCLSERMENTAPQYHFSPKPEFRPDTKFERRGQQLGHGVWDILFRKK